MIMMEDNYMSDYRSDYWCSTHAGYSFDENDKSHGTALSSSVRKNEDYQSLKCQGLIEVTENKSPEDLSSHILYLEEDKNLQTVATKYNPLEQNIKQEKQENIRLTAAQTVKCMVLGQSYSLDGFKGKESKIDLLKSAVLSHDGNAILTVLLFLRSTLKKSIFQREIRQYPHAVNVYLNYLEDDHEIDELMNMFLLLDCPDEAAMIKYRSALSLQHPDRKAKSIDNCLNAHFQPSTSDEFLHTSVLEHRQLLRDQIAVEEHHSADCHNETETFKCYQLLSNEAKLVDTSVMCSLLFCSLFYYEAPEVSFISPIYVKNKYKLSQKQFTWGAVRALVATKKWPEMDNLFITKNWLGNSKIKSYISFSQLIRLLAVMEAPHDYISKYVQFIENQELKLSLAKKFKCHSIVIEILKNNRDRAALLEYKNILPPHSVDFCSATDILNNKTVKWRN